MIKTEHLSRRGRYLCHVNVNFVQKNSDRAFQEWIAGKRDISIRHWNWECGDGCCSDYGTDVYVNDFKLVHADGSNTESTLDAMLDFLGYDNVKIEETYDYDDDCDDID